MKQFRVTKTTKVKPELKYSSFSLNYHFLIIRIGSLLYQNDKIHLINKLTMLWQNIK